MSADLRRPVRPPPAVRHDGAALRERALPHRPHHGVHPGRHLGAVPADAGTRGAFRLRRRHARRGDHAEGRRRRHDAAGAGGEDRRDAPEAPRRLPHQLRSLALDRLAGERRAVAGHLPAPARPRAVARHDEAGRAVLRSGQGDVPAGSLHQGRVPEMRREGPVRRRLRGLRPAQFADRVEESVLDDHRRDAGAQVVGALLLPARPTPRASSSSGNGRRQPGRLQPEVANKALEWLGDDATEGGKGLADWDISRDAPYFGIPIPDAPGKYFYVWLDAPVGYLASLKAHLAQAGHRLRASSCRVPTSTSITSSARTSSISTRCSGRRCSSSPARRTRCPDNVFVHGFLTALGEKMSKSRGTGISPDRLSRPRPQRRMAALLHRGQAEREGRGHRLQPRRLHRARQQRSHRQVREHREPRGAVPDAALRRQARHAERHRGAPQAAHGHARSTKRSRPRKLYDAREFGKVLRDAMRIADGINEAFDAAEPWLLAKDPAKRDELQTVCSKALQGFQLLTVMLAPVLPAVASRVARELFGLERDFVWADAWAEPASIRPYQHLMARIDPKHDRCAAGRAERALGAALHGVPHPRLAAAGAGTAAAAASPHKSRSTTSPRSTCVSRRSSTPSTSTAPTSCSS